MAITDLGQLTSSELATQTSAATDLLHQTDPDILSPTLRQWIGELFGRLDEEKMRRKNLSNGLANVTTLHQRSPHEEI